MTQASRRKSVSIKVLVVGGDEDAVEQGPLRAFWGHCDRPGRAFMPRRRLYSCHACWVWGLFYRTWSVVKTWAPNVNASCSASLSDTRNYKVVRGKTVSIVRKIHAGLFSSFLSMLPLIISAFNSCSTLKGAVSLMLAMELWSAQLRHQNGVMTARPHAAKVTCTGSQKESLECFHSSTKCFPPE